MRDAFETQLSNLHQELIRMGEACEEIIDLAARALTAYSPELEEKTKQVGAAIDESEHTIETTCLKLLLRQQPVASDLRQISSAMKMITDMERIGDHGTDISELTILMSGYRYPEVISAIEEMSKVTTEMLIDAVDAFAWENAVKAQSVIDLDDRVDELFLTAKESIAKTIRENGGDAMQELDLLMVAKYFERIGDHATNIAEWVKFSVNGDLPADD